MRVNWDHIEDEKAFQRLNSHLLGLECPAVGFIPSSPYIGKDGGWDGFYDGLYPVEGIEGVFSFQAKWTKYNRKEAKDYLKTCIPTEIEKAIGKGVQHLRISTNAELDVDQVRELEALDKGSLTSLKVWQREALTLRIEKRPFLMHMYFGLPQHPLFLPWDFYTASYEPHLLPNSVGEIDSFNLPMAEAERFLNDPNCQILVVHGPAGYGKSHLIREVTRISTGLDQAVEPMWARLPLREIQDAIQNEIIHEKKYLLVIDDADRSPEGIKALTTLLPTNRGRIKIVLGTRSATKTLVDDAINESGYNGMVSEVQIPDWSKTDLIHLLRFCAGKQEIEGEEEIVSTYRFPYLITWIGHNMAGTAKPVAELLNDLVSDLQRDAIRASKGVSNDEYTIKRILLKVALMVPFSPTSDSPEIGLIADQEGISSDRVYSLIRNWIKVGILREVGFTCRFSPDLKGEFFLNQQFSLLDESAIETLVESLMNLCPDRIFANLGSTCRLGEISVLQSYLTKKVSIWIKSASETNAIERSDKLEKVERFAFAVPDSVIDLMRTYLETTTPSTEEDESVLNKRYGPFKLTTDHYGPVITQLIKIGVVRKRVVSLICQLQERDIEGTYGNYRPGELIQQCVCPLENTIEFITSTLHQIKEGPTKLVADALSEIVAGAHEHRRSSGKSITIGEKYLTNPEQAAKFRNEAIQILEDWLISEKDDEFDAALEVASKIGQTTMGRLQMKELPLYELFGDENKRIIAHLTEQLLHSQPLQRLVKIENFLLNHWAQVRPGSEEAAEILRKYNRTPEYLFLHYYHSPENTIEDFGKVEQGASNHNEGRWSYFVRNVNAEKRKEEFTDYSGLIPVLRENYQTEEEIIVLMNSTEEQLKNKDTRWSPPILKYWATDNSAPFLNIRKNESLWQRVPERFQIEIDLALSEIDPDSLDFFLNEMHEGISDISPPKCGLFLDIITECLSRERMEEEFEFLIKHRGAEFARYILHQVFRVYKRTGDVELTLRLVESVINQQEKMSESVVDGVAFVIHCLKDDDKLTEVHRKHLSPLLIPAIARMEEISHDGNQILGDLIEDLDEFVNFLESRLVEAKRRIEDRDFSLDLSPYNGIPSITSMISDLQTFKRLMTHYCDWYSRFHQYMRHDLYQLMKPLKTLRDNEGTPYLPQVIFELVTEEKYDNAFLLADHLSFDEESFEALISLCEKSLLEGSSQEVRSLLFHFTLPPDGWRSEIGEAPPELVQIISTFKQLRSKTEDSELHLLIDECVLSVEGQIDSQIRRDKDVFDE